MAVTVTYQHPVTGIVAPTALQAATRVSATITATQDADVAATVVHNFGLSAAELAAGDPVVILTPLDSAIGILAGWACSARGANDITLECSNAGGTGDADPQLQVEILYPHSIIN